MRWDCGICARRCSTFSELCTHIQFWHAKGFNITCGIDGCQQTFRTASALRSHGYRNHETAVGTDIAGTTIVSQGPTSHPEPSQCDMEISNSPTVIDDDRLSCHDGYDDMDSDGVMECSPTGSSSICNAMSLPEIHQVTSDAITDMFLKFRETNAMPTSTTRKIFTDFSFLFHGFYSFLKDSGVINENFVSDMNDQFFLSLFDKVSSDWKVSEHLNQHPQFVPQVTRKLSDNFNMEHVPVSDTLRVLFDNDDFYAEVIDYLGKPPSPSELSDFKDGSESHSVSNGCGICDFVIPLIFYTDEFEVCNPIGAARIKHKIAAVYYTLACLPPKLHSKRKDIFLSALILWDTKGFSNQLLMNCEIYI